MPALPAASARAYSGMEGTTVDIDQIFRDYRNGDEDRRLSLFLSYRDLRSEFSRIEEERQIVHLPDKGVLTWLKWIAGSP